MGLLAKLKEKRDLKKQEKEKWIDENKHYSMKEVVDEDDFFEEIFDQFEDDDLHK
jgi:hypothetical protein